MPLKTQNAMATKPRVNSAVLERKLRATITASRMAADAGIKELGATGVEVLVDLSPRDTNSYVNGWISAGRSAGVTDRPLFPYVESRNRSRFVQRLVDQIEETRRVAEHYESRAERYEFYVRKARENDFAAGPRKDGKPRKPRAATASHQKNIRLAKEYAAKARRARKRIDRAKEELAKVVGADTFIFFDNRFDGRNLSTVRTQRYGGVGIIKRVGNRRVVELTNQEPHVRPVERNPALGHPVATAKALMAAAGKASAGRAYRAELRRRSPMAA